MTPVKFECPGCGQHLECDKACCGDIIHCPRCCAELRIPFASPKELPGVIARAELIMHAPASNSPGPEPAATSADGAQKPPPPSPIEVSCPVCQSELRVKPPNPTEPKSPVMAELVQKAQPKAEPAPQATTPKPPQPDVNHMSPEERERQIAAARESHPISLYPSMKPRLDKVLSGDMAPVKPADAETQKQVRRPPRGSEGGAGSRETSLSE